MNTLKQANMVAQIWPGARLKSARRLTGGVSAEVYALEVADDLGNVTRSVLREHAPVHTSISAELEYKLLKALHCFGLPVPEPLLFDASCSLLANPFVMMSFIEGHSAIPSGDAFDYIDKMASQLFKIHQVPVQGLPGLPERVDPRPDVFDYLPEASEWIGLRASLRVLSGTRFEGAPCLLHGDYWAQNLLWHGGQITGVLDWEDAAIGDPLADVAAASVELRYLFGRPGQARFIAAYSAFRPVEAHRLALWQVYVAASAHHFMSGWQLPPADEANRRREGLASIREAERVLRASASIPRPSDPFIVLS